MGKAIPARQNTATREKLLETSKQLFYKQGYSATTLAQISAVSEINNGLITYYFGSKNNLASEIYTAFVISVRAEVSRQLFLLKKDYLMELGMAVEWRFMLSIKIENENIMRFYTEYIKERDQFSDINEKREHYYHVQKTLVNPYISDQDLRFYEVCGVSVMRSVSEAYAKGFLKCDRDYLEDYVVRLLFEMLRLPAYRVETLVDESRYYKDKMKIKVGEGFELLTA